MNYTVAQYAAKSGIDKAAVYALCRAGLLPARKNEVGEWEIVVLTDNELPITSDGYASPVKPAGGYPPGLIDALVDRVAGGNGNKQGQQTPIVYVQGPPTGGGMNDALIKIIEVFGPPLVNSIINKPEKESPLDNIRELIRIIQENQPAPVAREPEEDKAMMFFQYVMPYLPALMDSLNKNKNAKTETNIPEPESIEESEELREDFEPGRRYNLEYPEGTDGVGRDYEAELTTAFPGRPDDSDEGINTPSDGDIGDRGGGL